MRKNIPNAFPFIEIFQNTVVSHSQGVYREHEDYWEKKSKNKNPPSESNNHGQGGVSIITHAVKCGGYRFGLTRECSFEEF